MTSRFVTYASPPQFPPEDQFGIGAVRETIAGVTVDWIGDRPSEQDVAARLSPKLQQGVIAKDDIWRRATDEEAVQMRAALDSQPVRLQEIYAGATFISPDDELFGVLQGALVALFGERRAAELLARSN